MASALKQRSEEAAKAGPARGAQGAQRGAGGYSSSATLTARPALPLWLIQHSRLGISCGPEAYFSFSKVKRITDTLNPRLSPISHDIPVPTWPVKTLALSRELWI